MIAFALILSVSNMNDPAMRAVADASAQQLHLDGMVNGYIERSMPNKYKGSLKVVYGLNDVINNKRLTLHWSFK